MILRKCIHNIEVCSQCSKREERRAQFAARVVQGIYSAWDITEGEFKENEDTPEAMRTIAYIAVKQADALLAALEQRHDKAGT